MADDMKNTDPNTPQQPDAAPQPPVTPEPPTEPMPQQQPPMGQQIPPAQSQPQPQPQQPMYGAPQPQPQAFYPPAPLMQLTGGMKFAWLVVGALMGIPGIIISWLVNVDKMPQVKSDALKFTVIGFVINIVFWFIMSFLITGAISAAVYGMMGSLDSGSYGYGYHGSW